VRVGAQSEAVRVGAPSEAVRVGMGSGEAGDCSRRLGAAETVPATSESAVGGRFAAFHGEGVFLCEL